MLRKILLLCLHLVDALVSPIVVLGAILFKIIRRAGLRHMPIARRIFLTIGVLPIRDHYYEPLFKMDRLRFSLRKDRSLPGIDLNLNGQLELLRQFNYQSELDGIPYTQEDPLRFYYDNGSFMSGDAEYLYSLIRLIKPIRIIEIGSGFSTLMARLAISKNQVEDPNYYCKHTCIEPFAAFWLDKIGGVEIIRKKVEEIDVSLFLSLGKNDILFIDSSHVIRPQGDVLWEYFSILPVLVSGVIIHIHDIFTPRDYLDEWLYNDLRLWNEQYLVEAFMHFNKEFKIIGALNFLMHNHREEFYSKFPVLSQESVNREPGSFWIQKV